MLYWAGTTWAKNIFYEPSPKCRIGRWTCWSAVQHTTVMLRLPRGKIGAGWGEELGTVGWKYKNKCNKAFYNQETCCTRLSKHQGIKHDETGINARADRQLLDRQLFFLHFSSSKDQTHMLLYKLSQFRRTSTYRTCGILIWKRVLRPYFEPG